MRTSRFAGSAVVLALLALAACRGDAGVERNPDVLVRIRSGLYGEMIAEGPDYVPPGSDASKSGDRPLPDRDVNVYGGDAVLSARQPPPPPLRTAKTGQTGFFEVELEAGRYQVCAPTRNGNNFYTGECARFEVGAQARVRGDYWSGRPSRWTIAGVRAEDSSDR